MSLRPVWLGIFVALLVTGYVYNALADDASEETQEFAYSIQVVDPQGAGVAGAQVSGESGMLKVAATTDEAGKFVFKTRQKELSQLTLFAVDDAADQVGMFKANYSDPPTPGSDIKITLSPCRKFPIEVVTVDGDPAADVEVGAVFNYFAITAAPTDGAGKTTLRLPVEGELTELFAYKQDVGFDYKVVKTRREPTYPTEWLSAGPIRFQLAEPQTIELELLDDVGSPIPDTVLTLWLLNKPGEPDDFNLSYTMRRQYFYATTDQQGIATFRGVPNWATPSLIFWPNVKQHVRERIVFDPQEHKEGKMTIKLNRQVPISGVVLSPEGEPVAGASVIARGSGYQIDDFNGGKTTDEQGRFTFNANPNMLYVFQAQKDKLASPLVDGIVLLPGQPVTELQLQLQPATRVHGVVTSKQDGKPLASRSMQWSQHGRSLSDLKGVELPKSKASDSDWVSSSLFRHLKTDEQGKYELFVAAGKQGIVVFENGKTSSQQFEVTDQPELEINFSLDVKESEKFPFSGLVVTGNPPQPVDKVILEGRYRADVFSFDLRMRTDAEGRFTGLRLAHPFVLYAKTIDGELAGIIEVAADQNEATMSIAPLASAKGRIIDQKTGEPLADQQVQWGRQIKLGDDKAMLSTTLWGGSVQSDAEGRFEITGLVIGQPSSVSVKRGYSYSPLVTHTPETTNMVDLGDLKLRPLYKPPTFAERVQQSLTSKRKPLERFDYALSEAKRLRQNVLVIFTPQETPLAQSWFKLRLDDQDVRVAMFNYQVIQCDVADDSNSALADKLGVSLSAEKLPSWYLCDANGKPLEQGTVPRTEAGDAIDRAALLETLQRHIEKPLDAKELLSDALEKAKASDRRVIVQETATWCGPCHMLSRYLEKHRAIWEKDYVWIKIDQRWTGWQEVMDGIEKENRGGIPWFAILDADGKVLADSNGPDGNIGFPSEPAGIEHFMTMLRSTRQQMTDEELGVLQKHLEEK